ISALKAGSAIALCKTRFATEFLQHEFKLAPHYVGFTTPEPCEAENGPAYDVRLVAHLAGTSGMKGTLAVLRAWAECGGVAHAATLLVTRQPSAFARTPNDLAYWDGLKPEPGATYLGIAGLERHGNMY